VGKKMAEKRQAEERAKVEKEAQKEAARLEVERQKSNPNAARLDASASRFNNPKKGFLWGGGNDVLGNYSILNNYNLIFEPILLSFEMLSLALLSQYNSSVSSLPNVIKYANIYIKYQNNIYTNVKKKLQNKHTRINKKMLINKKTVNKRSANKRRSTSKRRSASKRPISKRRSINKPYSKKTYNPIRTNIGFIP
jgi:hypothetical protein